MDLDRRIFQDPTRKPWRRPRPRRPPPGTPPNPALCKRCNVSLQIDDSFFKRYLKTSETGYLCLAIRSYLWPWLVFGGINYIRDDHVATLPGLSRAAESGCRFCAAVKEGLQEKYQGTPWWKPHPKPLIMRFQYCWRVDICGRLTLDSVVVSVKHPELPRDTEPVGPERLRSRDWDDDAFRFVTYGVGDDDPCSKWLNLPREMSDNPWSPQNISLCQRWINECVDGMGLCEQREAQPLGPARGPNDGTDECPNTDGGTADESEARATGGAGAGRTRRDQSGEHNSSSFLPTRLLDLFPSPAQSPDCISLVETSLLQRDNPESHAVRYAALSYCWGNVKPTATTTKETLNSHLDYIEFSALPQCLKDAVIVTRGLGIRYLWIDALCIIQDDSGDWGRESGTMYQIFYNSFVTIAAAASESFNEGFLIPRRRVETIEMSFSSALNPQIFGSFSLSLTCPKTERGECKDPLKLELQDCKWDTRGWVWQEQKLSKRLLVFGKRMIHLKCDHYIRSENGTNLELELEDAPREAGRDSWKDRLDEFAGKQLTFLRDKLPAISGLSRLLDQNSRLRGEGPAQYLAGSWYCSESRDPRVGWQGHLLWELTSQEQSFENMFEQLKNTDPGTYIAPSWSWASRPAPAHFDMWTDEAGVSPPHFEAKIENHHMVLTGPDPMGQVGPGSYLELSGLMCRDPLKLSAAEKSSVSFEWHISQTPFIVISLDWKYSPEDEADDMLKGSIRLFGLYKWEWPYQGHYVPHYRRDFKGLLLLQDSESGHYFRVGWFAIPGRRNVQVDLEQYYCERWEQQSIRIL